MWEALLRPGKQEVYFSLSFWLNYWPQYEFGNFIFAKYKTVDARLITFKILMRQ